MEEYFETFRLNVKFYREARKMSQYQLAIEADCTNGMIGQIEFGRTKPSFDMIVRLSKALKVHPADLFLRDTSRSKNEVHKILTEMLDNDFKELFTKKFGI